MTDAFADPYEPPTAALQRTDVPPGRIYTAHQVLAGTVLGSVFAGLWMIAANYEAFGEHDRRGQVLRWGGLAAALYLILALWLPQQAATGLSLGAAFGMYQAAQQLFRERIEAHLRTGGLKQSYGRVFLVSLLSVAVLAAVFIGVLFVAPESWVNSL